MARNETAIGALIGAATDEEKKLYSFIRKEAPKLLQFVDSGVVSIERVDFMDGTREARYYPQVQLNWRTSALWLRCVRTSRGDHVLEIRSTRGGAPEYAGSVARSALLSLGYAARSRRHSSGVPAYFSVRLTKAR